MSPDWGAGKLAMSPDWESGKPAMSWLRSQKAGNVLIEEPESWQWVLIASFSVPQSGHCQFSGALIRTHCQFFSPQSGLIATYSGPQLGNIAIFMIPQSGNIATFTVPFSTKLKLLLSFFSEEGFDEKFKYCFRSSKSCATSYQKIPNQWRVPLILHP